MRAKSAENERAGKYKKEVLRQRERESESRNWERQKVAQEEDKKE